MLPLLRAEELEVVYRRAEDDKNTLLDYVEDLRRGKQRDQGTIDELTMVRDDARQKVAALEAKRVELEQLLKDQLQVWIRSQSASVAGQRQDCL